MKGPYIETQNYITVNGKTNLPRAGDRIWHKDNISGVDVERVGIVYGDPDNLRIKPAYSGVGNDMAVDRKVTDGLEWSLIQREE